jgi:putative membrane protein
VTGELRGGLGVLLLPLVVACGGDREAEDTQLDAVAMAEAAALSGSLIAPVRATSAALIQHTDLAVQRAVRDDVREYARTVGRDHRALVQALDSVVQADGLQSGDTAVSRDMADAVRMAHSGLEALEGGEFELAFIRAQVESHRELLERLEVDLLPAAPTARLRQLLLDVQALEAAHLTRARQLLAAILGVQGRVSPQGESPTAPPVRADTTIPPRQG